MEKPPKYKWLNAYTWVLLANAFYLIIFYLLMISF